MSLASLSRLMGQVEPVLSYLNHPKKRGGLCLIPLRSCGLSACIAEQSRVWVFYATLQNPLVLPPTQQRFRDCASFEYVGGDLIESAHLIERAHHLVAPLLPQLSECLGWIGIDLILGTPEDAAEDVVIEINPRLTSSYLVVRRVNRQNLAGMMLSATDDGISARFDPAE